VLRFCTEDDGFPYFASTFNLCAFAQAAISSADFGCGTLRCRFIESGREDMGWGAANAVAEKETSKTRWVSDVETGIMIRKKANKE